MPMRSFGIWKLQGLASQLCSLLSEPVGGLKSHKGDSLMELLSWEVVYILYQKHVHDEKKKRKKHVHVLKKKFHLYRSYSNTKHEIEQDFTRFKSFTYQIFSELLSCGRFQEAPGTVASLCGQYTLVGTAVLGKGGERWWTREINKANSIRRANEPTFKGSRDSRLQKPMCFFIISKETCLLKTCKIVTVA